MDAIWRNLPRDPQSDFEPKVVPDPKRVPVAVSPVPRQPVLLPIRPLPGHDSGPASGPQLNSGVDGATAYTFPDVADTNLQWYVPTVSVVMPSPANTVAVSPFSFQFRVSGHDQHGAPIIDATVVATVQADPVDASRAALPADATTRAVPFSSLGVNLVIPFRDTETGQPRSSTVSATTVAPTTAVPSGSGWTATFQLTGDLARACYGSLSTPNYQDQPTQLSVSYAFDVNQHRPFFIGIPFRPVTDPDDPLAPPPEPLTVARSALARPLQLEAVRSSELRAGALAQRINVGIPMQPADPEPGRSLFVMGWRTISLQRQLNLPLFVACHDFGALYVDITDAADPRAVGCQDAIALGTAPSRLYRLLDAHTTADYTVYASVGRASVYLLLPRRYRVGRTAPGSNHPAVPDFSPAIRWVQAFDATQDAQLPCQLQASLVPDLQPGTVIRLLAALTAEQIAGAPPATLLLPTSSGAGLNSMSVASWNSGQSIVTSLNGDSVQFLAAMTWNDAVVFNTNLQNGGSAADLVGNANFALTDGETLPVVELHVGIDDLAGPWPDGPVLVDADGAGSVTVQNNSTGTATLSGVLAAKADGSMTILASGLTTPVPAGESVSVALTSGTSADGDLVAEYTVTDDTDSIASQRVFLEDLHTTVTVVNDVQWSKDNLAQVDLTFRLDSDTATIALTMSPSLPMIQIDIVQPMIGGHQQNDTLLHVGHATHAADGTTSDPVDTVVDLSRDVIYSLNDLLHRGS